MRGQAIMTESDQVDRIDQEVLCVTLDISPHSQVTSGRNDVPE